MCNGIKKKGAIMPLFFGDTENLTTIDFFISKPLVRTKLVIPS